MVRPDPRPVMQIKIMPRSEIMNIPKECYEQFGPDLDGCSTQENEGCGRCKIANNPVHPNHVDEAAGMTIDLDDGRPD